MSTRLTPLTIDALAHLSRRNDKREVDLMLVAVGAFCYYPIIAIFHPSIKEGAMNRTVTAFLSAVILMSAACSGGALTTREKGAGIGALGGAAAGGLIGAATGHAGAGAAIGGVLGLGAGALVGDQLQGQQNTQTQQQRQIDGNQAELDRQRRELEELRRRKAEY
jgi:hypothetical protein